MNRTLPTVLLAAALATGGCGAPAQYLTAERASFARSSATLTLPSEILYVLGGSPSTHHPDIEVFDAAKKGSDQKPIYTIPPRGGGEYDLLDVDSSNDLYALNYFHNGAELDVFPPGSKRPSLQCLLPIQPVGLSVAGKTLYLSAFTFKIAEYALPLHPGKTCPKPSKTLTDQFAKLRGNFFFGVAQDPQGDVFDTWQSAQGDQYCHIDIFHAGSETAHPYRNLYRGYGSYLVSDSRGDLATDVLPNYKKSGAAIGLFPYGDQQRKFYDYIPNGTYLGLAFANNDTELFAVKDYPATVVLVYAYDSAIQHVGKLVTTFSSGIYSDAQIAVYSAGDP